MDTEFLMKSRHFQALAARAYLKDPARTEAELIGLGCQRLATDLRHDHLVGRLQENQAILEPKPTAT